MNKNEFEKEVKEAIKLLRKLKTKKVKPVENKDWLKLSLEARVQAAQVIK